ncbi:UvrABC system protein A [Arenicella chitinivorans]|uniref:UvrABC system protein A n=1 Tax=Arenicella chitinivorans TaxID=1329800 RepID=A0A918RKY6_9GAMM|nr:excinuclease ABC subunit UvrA [Arenicella chitinivorans]GHA02193.1 UvrABC system protein A [Arenicella chitinivorans]
MLEKITIRGARTHNLKGIDLELPREKLIVITGLSGSGKSSLAFDTIYAEGQRRYVESLSAYARQFLSLMEKPDVDLIEGLSPAISIEQKATSHNPRSTVGTITEIYDYLRLLYARVGDPRCPDHKVTLEAQTISQMVDQTMALPEGSKIMLVAPVVRNRKGEFLNLLQSMHAQGYIRARVDGQVIDLAEPPALKKNFKHDIDIIIDRLIIKPGNEQRMAESFETALELAEGVAEVVVLADEHQDERTLVFSSRYACPHCGYSLSELEPRLFSFNNPVGACSSCDGLGTKQYFDPKQIIFDTELSLSQGAIKGWDRRSLFYFRMLQNVADHYDFSVDEPLSSLSAEQMQKLLYGSGDETIEFSYLRHKGQGVTRHHSWEGIIPNMERRYRETESNSMREELAKYINSQTCPDCSGSRLRLEARNVFINDTTINQIVTQSIGDALAFFEALQLTGNRAEIADKIVKEIHDRLGFLVNVGLNYLSMDRSAETLSGGEAQRIRLASQIGSGLVGVMYVLDEPSIGLHQRDNDRLIATLTHLRDLGNTVIVVEHDEDAMQHADFIVDIGPGAGVHGGEIVAQGTLGQIKSNPKSLTGRYLSGKEAITVPAKRHAIDKKKQITIKGAAGNNLRNVSVSIPIGVLTCVTGVSGSGKSTLINNTLYPAAAQTINRSRIEAAPHKSISGLDQVDKIVDINQSPIGRTPRSNPATYTQLFTPIRELFAGTPEARARGYKPGRFSFNVKGGRCEACQGDGLIKVEMHFLPDIYVACDVCKGQRYNRETLDIRYKGQNIHDVLEMTIEDAVDFFSAVPNIHKKLETLMSVGLGYIKLGQSAITLSGGEAQRIKLARELSKRDTGQTLYILDEPTTGLHFHDIRQLLDVLHTLRDHGNTIVVIEHNLDVIKTADWIIDLGPEGGQGGGTIVAEGTPEEVAQKSGSYTGHYLAPFLSKKSA